MLNVFYYRLIIFDNYSWCCCVFSSLSLVSSFVQLITNHLMIRLHVELESTTLSTFSNLYTFFRWCCSCCAITDNQNRNISNELEQMWNYKSWSYIGQHNKKTGLTTHTVRMNHTSLITLRMDDTVFYFGG